LRNEERQQLVRLLREARTDGTLGDNPTLVDLLDEQAQLERRIATLEAQLAGAQVAPPPRDGHAAVGSVLRVRDLGRDAGLRLRAGGATRGRSDKRPRLDRGADRARTGGKRGSAQIEVATPRGIVELEVTDVRPAPQALAERVAWRKAPAVGASKSGRAPIAGRRLRGDADHNR